MRLLGVELRRLRWRRLTKVAVALLLLAGITLSVLASNDMTKPLTSAEVAQGAQMAKDMNAQNTPAQQRDCEAQRETARKGGEDVSGWRCTNFTGDMYIRHPASAWDAAQQVPQSLAYLGLLGVLVVVSSFIGAEFSSGSIGNHLTVEPRRTRVFWSKILAAGLGSLCLAALLAACLMAANWVPAVLHHASTAHDPGLPGHLLWSVVRAVVALGVIGAALAGLSLLLRHTAAVVGVAIGYAVVAQVLVNQVSRLGKWELTRALDAVVTGQGHYYATECRTGADGYTCSAAQHTFTLAHGAWELGVVCAAVLLISWAVFRRRDVN